ncbi:Uric acid degradation bifunctional protein PucL [Salinisphaera shabanensis E1L3A]|uniref:Uricase n=1 Tax=Salinisphaera shabanensis E1L3A TaxID=1033802 RepID=U2FZV1_9GAMM|nr:urate oxidase [Salinisphaera shabanensis]ERJ19608.1 Uric acid degradation bifunctional protein PucL [Salinisphaera shabanensis E1L3A]
MNITHIEYGKCAVTMYRSYAAPLTGITPIPESGFTGRANRLFAVDVEVHVLGDHFEAAYTKGDNQAVVATDTMKNFILKQGLAFEGATIEGLLHFLATRFLDTYADMAGMKILGREQPFMAAQVPDSQGGLEASDRLFSRSRDDFGYAEMTVMRGAQAHEITAQRSGRLGMQLIKLTGSSFMNFPRDEHTTLPERRDRPLFIYLDVYWRYRQAANAVASDHRDYVDAQQLRDLLQVVFHEFNSLSIQHLVHAMGERIFARYPQLGELHFEAQNRLWDTAFEADDGHAKTYCDPRPPYGHIMLTVTPDDG